MIQKFNINEKLSPAILCNEFHKQYTNDDLNNLPKWKRDYIIRNKPLYNKYKKEWDEWYSKYKDILNVKLPFSILTFCSIKTSVELVPNTLLNIGMLTSASTG